jgi:CheY-like chemotaxis protein
MSTKDWYILVVEDDPDGQEVIGRILKYHGVNADVVFSAEEALPLLTTRSYTAAIVDLALPGMDGWSLLKMVHNNNQTANLPCFAVTAYHSADVAIKAIESGFIAYFPKPIDATALVREMQHTLG